MKRSLIVIIILSIPLNIISAKGEYETFEVMLDSILKESVPFIETEDLEHFVNSLNGYYLLDFRSEEEFSVSHIKNAVFVDHKKFRIKDVKDIPKDSIIIVYCSVGYRSEAAGEILLSNGYKSVYNLYGGIFKWVNEGMPVYNDTGLTDEIHGYSKEWGRWLKSGDIKY